MNETVPRTVFFSSGEKYEKNEKPRKRDFPLGLSKGIDMNKHAPCAKEGMLHMIQNYDRANITVQKYIYFLHI